MTPEQKQEFQNQIDLQKIANEKKQMMNDTIVKKMDTVFFPKDQLTDFWRDITKRAMMATIPVVNKTSIVDFVAALKAVNDPEGEITMNQFQVLANSLDTASPASIGFDVDQYILAVEEITSMVEVWKGLLEKLHEETTIEVEKEISKRVAATHKNILQPIKGEA